MYDMTDDTSGNPDVAPETPSAAKGQDQPISEADKALVKQIQQKIRADKRHHEKAFRRMRRDMQVAMWGAEETWGDTNYRANIVGRHVKMKTAALYAKNPKAVARRRETLDFAIWDENPATLQLAFQTVQLAEQQMQMQAQNPGAPPPPGSVPMGADPAGADPMAAAQPAMPQQAMEPQGVAVSQRLVPQLPNVVPQIQVPPGFEQAKALMEDFQQGYARREMLKKYGKTLEVLFAQALREQKPLDFKRGMKQVVRRACTTGVGYVELGFQREMGPRPGLTEQLADARTRLDHLKNLAQQVNDGEIYQDDGEMAELERSVADLQNQPEIVLREGLITDFPQSTKVIPDKLCKNLDGFTGARHLTLEYSYTVDEVKEIFDVDIGNQYTSYAQNEGSQRTYSANDVMDDDYAWGAPETKGNGLVCVWKHYDKPSGLVYYVADGYPSFLREPAAPDVFVEDFWPVYALTFNAVENEKELFPPSDVALLIDMQREHNRARQGKREHRHAARPRWVYSNGLIEDEDVMFMRKLRPFQALGLNMDPAADISKIFQTMPVPGVDPNLYDTGEVFTDMQLVGGAQEAQYGGVAKATATESAIAAGATNASDASSIDDLDSFLTTIARASGQILQKEMSEEKVREIVGPGAVWPQLTLADIANEIFLEVEAGSTGKPNQAVEISNWQQMVPLLIQVPGLDPQWLLKEMLRRLDDRLDVTEALASGIPSIISQNSQSQPGLPGQGPEANPNMQGQQGGNNAPQAPGQPGSGPAFGSNQVPGRV